MVKGNKKGRHKKYGGWGDEERKRWGERERGRDGGMEGWRGKGMEGSKE
jgi:hypothetical protein